MTEGAAHASQVIRPSRMRLIGWAGSGVQLSRFATAGALATVLMDARAGSILYPAGLAVTATIALAALLLPPRRAMYALLLFVTIAPDLTQSAVDVAAGGGAASATIWQLRIGPLSGAWAVMALAGLLLVRLPRARLTPADWVFLAYFGVVGMLMSLRFGFLTTDSGAVLTDAKLPVFLLLAVLLFGGYCRAFPSEFPRLIAAAAMLFVIRAGVDFTYLLAGVERTVIGDVNRLSVDSAKGMVVVPAFWALHRILDGKHRLLHAGLFIAAMILLITYQTRFLLVTFALGIVLAAVLLRRRGALAIALGIPLLSYVLAAVVSAVMPDVARTAWLRLVSLRSESGSIQVDIDRYAAIVNTTATLSRNSTWLTGMGYGAWYADRDFPFTTVDESAFELQAYRTGRFPRVHDFAFHVLFKHGLLGIFAYLILFAIPARGVFTGHTRAPPWARHAAFVLLATLPTIVLTLYWTGKGLLIAGGTIATLRWLRNEIALERGAA